MGEPGKICPGISACLARDEVRYDGGQRRLRLAAETLATYGARFIRTPAVSASRARHVNVLQHLAGLFKRQLSDDERAELDEVIGEYRRGLVPLVGAPTSRVDLCRSWFDETPVAPASASAG